MVVTTKVTKLRAVQHSGLLLMCKSHEQHYSVYSVVRLYRRNVAVLRNVVQG